MFGAYDNFQHAWVDPSFGISNLDLLLNTDIIGWYGRRDRPDAQPVSPDNPDSPNPIQS